MQLKNRKGVVLTESSQMSDKYVSSKGLVIRSFGKALNICESIKMKPIKYLWNIRRGPWATSLTLETVPSKNKKNLSKAIIIQALWFRKKVTCVSLKFKIKISSPHRKRNDFPFKQTWVTMLLCQVWLTLTKWFWRRGKNYEK